MSKAYPTVKMQSIAVATPLTKSIGARFRASEMRFLIKRLTISMTMIPAEMTINDICHGIGKKSRIPTSKIFIVLLVD